MIDYPVICINLNFMKSLVEASRLNRQSHRVVLYLSEKISVGVGQTGVSVRMAPVVRSWLPSSQLKLLIFYTIYTSRHHSLLLMADSGLVVVLCVVTLLLVVVFIPLLSVEYQWCHVLFDNSTVSTLHIIL